MFCMLMEQHSSSKTGSAPSQRSSIDISGDVRALLTRTYYDPSRVGSYGGVNRLHAEVSKLLEKVGKRITVRTVRTWLADQEPYVRHKRVRTRKFERNPITYRDQVGDLFQGDLIFYTDIPHNGYNYLLLVQDTASRYLMHKFCKTKTCIEVLNKFKELLREIGFIPRNFLVDTGKEWFCKEFVDWAEQVGCNVYSIGSGDSGKTPMLDRSTRYLQERLHAFFTHRETTNWVYAVPKLLSSQNRTYHSTIKMTPKEAWEKKRRETDVWVGKKREDRGSEKRKYKVGQWVSIMGPELGSLTHKYKGEWTLVRFKIVRIDDSRPKRLVYYVEDELGEPIKNRFYAEELTPATYVGTKRVERVLKTKTEGGVKWELVKYKNRDKRFNEWIRVASLKPIRKVAIRRRKRR
jgi:hypothetical protein